MITYHIEGKHVAIDDRWSLDFTVLNNGYKFSFECLTIKLLYKLYSNI